MGKFDLGQTLITPGARDALAAAGINPAGLLTRHHAGDWGDVSEDSRQQNEEGLMTGDTLMSVYKLSDDLKIWIITEWDRSVTTILLPEEY